ncbi:unnamed protein product [Dicrocoelium dendriticum]|nr:unnamed protein product [Dicrocoelium dendriticum]
MSPLISAQDEFPDSAFSASSVLLNKTDFQPYQARLIEVYGSREHTSGYAWCPASPVGEMLQDWIQAEFPDLVMIKSIFTAGRGDGNVKEFMPSFVLRYQRQDGGTWYEHVKRDGARVLLANSDPRNLARATLDSMVIAKRVRLYPYSRTSNQNVCLRFALYGCKFPDGVVSYSMPQGGLGLTRASYHSVSRGDALEDNNVVRQLKDLFYDGQIVGTTYQQLTDGLGQLMDNVAFLGNLTRESDVYPSQPGFHFVGWHQAEHSEVQILFEFDTARRFTWIRLFTYDSIQLRVRLFSRATVAFSSDGVRFEDTLEFTTGRVHFYDSRSRTLSRPQRSPTSGPGDSKRTRQSTISQPEVRIYADPEYGGAVVVEMDLIKRVAKYIRLTIIPTDNWFVLSEIQFNSTVAAPSKSSLHTQTSSLQSDRNTSNQLSRNLKNKPVDLSSNIGAQSGASPGAQGSTNGRARETATVINNRPKHQSSPSASAKQTGSLVADSANFINDLIPSNEKFVTVLPIIITIAFLLLLLPTVLLVWLCTRKHRKRTRLLCLSKHSAADGDRGGFHSHGRLGTGDLFTLGPNPALSTQEAAKLLAPYQQITAKPHPDGTFATAGPFCINNGNHLIHRIGDGTVIGSTTVGNMGQTVQYTSSHQPSGTGVLMTYSPDSSGSGTDRNAPFPVVSTLTQSMALNNCAQAPVEPTLYSQTDGNCISPEYASASIFSFTPPPSEPPNTDPPNTCSEATQAVTLHQSVPTYTVSFAHPCSGPNNVYAGPASMPVDLATLRIQSRQVPSGQLQTTVSPQTPGLLLLPQYPFGRVNGDDSQALYQSISSNPYVFPPEAGHPCNMYSPDHQTTSQQHVNGYTNRITMGTEVNNGWVPSTTKRLSATPQDMDPKQTSWGPEVPWGASANAYLLSNPIHLNVLPHSHASEMLAFTQSGSQIPPQHYIPTHLVFPMLSTQQPSNPLVENIHDCNARQIDSNFRRASSVGATKGPVGYPALSHENCIRDGPGSGRLSIYSVCT